MKCPKCGAENPAGRSPKMSPSISVKAVMGSGWSMVSLKNFVNPVPKGSRKCWKQNLEIHPLQ